MATILDLGCCRAHLEECTVEWPDRTLRLTEIESKLLRYLSQHVGEPIAREELLQKVWGYSPKVQSRAADQTIKRLRPKIETDPKNPSSLRSAVGVGYMLILPVRDTDTPKPVTPGKLPRLAGKTFGRAEAIRGIADQLQPDEPLVLCGAPGVGKSHLALALARRWRDERNPIGGVWVIDCSAVQEGESLIEAICHQAAVSVTDGLTSRELARRLQARGEALFVLDNLDRCEGVEPLLRELSADTGLFWLITLRRRLGPVLKQLTVESLDGDSAAELLRDRVASMAGELPLPDPDVRALVTALGQNPLAICLAATHCTVLPPKELLTRFQSDPRLLASTLANDSSRAVSLEQALSVTWSMLNEESKDALAAFSAIEAAIPLETAMKVTGTQSVSTLQMLAAHALLEPRYEDGEVAYRVPLLIRSYAGHQRPKAKEAGRKRLYAWLEDLFDQVWSQPAVFAWDAAIPLLRHEDDIRSALGTVRAADSGTRLSLALAEIARLRGDFYGELQILRALPQRFPEPDDPNLRLYTKTRLARTLVKDRDAQAAALAELSWADCTIPAPAVHLLTERCKLTLPDIEQAQGIVQQLRDLTEDYGNPLWIAVGRLYYGRYLGLSGDLGGALEEFHHAQLLIAGRSCPPLEAFAQYSRGYAALEMGSLQDAATFFGAARSIMRDAGDPRGPMLDALSGLVALLDDRYDEAEAAFRDASQYADARVLGWAREDELFMAFLEFSRGDIHAAERWLRASVDRGRRWGSVTGSAEALLAATRVALGADPDSVKAAVQNPAPWSDIELGCAAYIEHKAQSTPLDSTTLSKNSRVESTIFHRVLKTFNAMTEGSA